MDETDHRNVPSNTAWYCCHDPEEERYYEMFFRLCKKYNFQWVSADEKEKQFLSEVVRVTYERNKAKRFELSLSEIRPSFTQRLFPFCPPLTTV